MTVTGFRYIINFHKTKNAVQMKNAMIKDMNRAEIAQREGTTAEIPFYDGSVFTAL